MWRFLLQKAHSCVNPRRLSHFAWRLVGGSDLQGWAGKKSKPIGMIVSRLTQGLHYRAACDIVLAETINHVQSITQSNCRLACFWVHSKLLHLLCTQNFAPGVALLKQLYRLFDTGDRCAIRTGFTWSVSILWPVASPIMMSINYDTLISRFYANRESPQNRSTIPPCSLELYAAANNTALLAWRPSQGTNYTAWWT